VRKPAFECLFFVVFCFFGVFGVGVVFWAVGDVDGGVGVCLGVVLCGEGGGDGEFEFGGAEVGVGGEG